MAHDAPQKPRRENRLAQSSSPYLLQHRYNPVDWYPWGPEAFDAARKRDVPIFLSIGYSTCYWCHVMERESFESESIAEQMNEHFVCVKVDREERPDVDDIYMAAVQAFRGQGGWPMSVFLEPRSLMPFWAGTYFPAEPKFSNVPAFPQVLAGVSSAWQQDRAAVIEQAQKLAEAVRERVAETEAPVRVGVPQVTEAVASLLRLHDSRHGGFGGAPKFPQPVYLDLLLAIRPSAADETLSAIDAVVRSTLEHMALGGIFDQVGGGFHRYSVDEHWTVPHFEKMLYDNAQLISVYARAAKIYEDRFFHRTASRTIEYILREMTLTTTDAEVSGAFFSAQDAEVNHREGQNYLWTQAQVEDALIADNAALVVKAYSIDDGPNFRDPHHPDDPPANILRWPDSPANVAAQLNLPEGELLQRLDDINAKLYEVRQRRDQPSTDDKVIAAWNGLMIGALAEAGAILSEPSWVRAAEHAAHFALRHLITPDGSVRRTVRVDTSSAKPVVQPGGAGVLEDYAALAHGFLQLHRVAGVATSPWLTEAKRLLEGAHTRFADPASGGYFDTQADQPDLFVRARSAYDGALPSGSSLLVNALLDAFEISGDRAYFNRALDAIRATSAFVAGSPLGAAGTTRALFRAILIDQAAVQQRFADDAAPVTNLPEDFTPVEIHAAVERVALAPEQPLAIDLRVFIDDGYHVNAADPGSGPGAEDLVPFRVHIVNGGGVEVYADYPEGALYGPDGDIRVYAGEFELKVVLERKGKWTGNPLIAVTYQACTEDACLMPRTVELDVALDPRN